MLYSKQYGDESRMCLGACALPVYKNSKISVTFLLFFSAMSSFRTLDKK